VLPLESRGLSQDEAWFADAVTVDLTRTLGRWPNVLVIDHGSARKYKGKRVDPREAARDLGVRYVIHGAVGRAGERVYLDVTLVDSDSGAHRWSQRLDVERSRLANSIQDLNGGIARALTIEVGRSVGEHAAKMQPHEVAADDLAMRGFAVFMRGVSKENFTEARHIFEEAVSKDPDSVRALAGVSLTNSFIAIMHWTPDREAAERQSEEPLARLVSLDPGGDLTLMSRASVANMRNDWDGLLLVAGELIERYPSNPTSHHHRCSALLRLGRFESAIPSCERAIRISPLDSRTPIWKGLIGMNHFMLGRYATAVDYARQTVAANPNIAGYWPLLAAALALDGRRDEGSQVVKELRARHPDFETARIPALWSGKHPDFIRGRDLLAVTVRELGLP
jgi:TolB-like protein